MNGICSVQINVTVTLPPRFPYTKYSTDAMKFGVENKDQEKMVYFPLTNLPVKQSIY